MKKSGRPRVIGLVFGGLLLLVSAGPAWSNQSEQIQAEEEAKGHSEQLRWEILRELKQSELPARHYPDLTYDLAWQALTQILKGHELRYINKITGQIATRKRDDTLEQQFLDPQTAPMAKRYSLYVQLKSVKESAVGVMLTLYDKHEVMSEGVWKSVSGQAYDSEKIFFYRFEKVVADLKKIATQQNSSTQQPK